MSRFFQIALVVVFAPLWAPLMLVVAAAVLVFMGRPVFHCDVRAGLRGRTFSLLKFRTMKPGDAPDAERLTRFGSFLRKTSLDELPELLLVLRGDMALVGPRPLPARYLPRYSPTEARRHNVLPGITGWAQVNGRNALDWKEKFRLDVEYVERRSFFFDLKILLLTPLTVLRARGISHEGESTMPEFRAEIGA